MTTPKDLVAQADGVVREVLARLHQQEPAILVDSPPGAGKTGLVERAAVLEGIVSQRRCQVATCTNEQSFDLARRLCRGFARHRFQLFVSERLEIPLDLRTLDNLDIVTRQQELPDGACVVIANAAKWSWWRGPGAVFDLMIVDEAYQLADHLFHQIAGLARRFLLVGDPGQIAPVVTCELERWCHDPAGPHVPCPQALLVRHPGIARLRLPLSRRLPADTVAVIQPAFYPQLPFRALVAHGSRELRLSGVLSGLLGAAARQVEQGHSLALIELPARVTGQHDEEVSHTLAESVTALLEAGATVREGGAEEPLTARDVGVVCAHISQVNAVRAHLPESLSGVLVETAERFQGLERQVMFVHHPLSGRADFSDFQLDAGRLCVMLSRHRVACFVVTRAGVRERLLRHAALGERVFGLPGDVEHAGWVAHMNVMQSMTGAV